MPWNNLQIAPDEHSELTTTSSQASSSSSSPAIASAAHSPIPTSTSLSIPPEPAPTTSSTVAVNITNSVQASTTDAIIPNPTSSAYVNHNVNNGVIRHIPIYIEKKSFLIKEEPRPGPSMSTSMNETYRPNKSPVVNSRASVPESGRVSRNYIQEVRQNGPSPYSNTKSQFSSPELNSLSRTLNSQSEENAYPPRTLSRINKLNVIMESGKNTGEVIHHHPVFVKDTSKYWYKPNISREEAINMLRDKPPGTFVVRDSNSFPGAFGLALKVSQPPAGVPTGDGTELVRHFLIEPSPKGVKLKGCNNEPIFGSLAALVYQHSITPMALPTKLILPEYDPATSPEHLNAAQALLEQGAACNVTYICSYDTESLTGPEAVRRTISEAFSLFARGAIKPVSVHFKVSAQGITLTDNTRTLFFRRHYPVLSVTHAGVDPEERRWDNNNVLQLPPTYVRQAKIFGFVARKIPTRQDNACHVFAELDPEQPANAVVNFITKVMMGQGPKKSPYI
uniref:SH2 domain-containing protein n=1 Tax=Acrobeloides nanus TaxID=290746 RepID=A0A914ELP7_9BILA